MKASQIIEKARSYIGVAEKPNNNVIFNTEYYGHEVNGGQYAWCAVFIWYVFHSLKADNLYFGGQKTAYCPTLMNWFKQKKRFYTTPEVGDLVFYDFSGAKKTAGHVGIVSKILPNKQILAIEGNTSVSNQTNGGMVQERKRDLKSCIGFGRPEYEGNTIENKQVQTTVKPSNTTNLLFHEAAKDGVKFTVTATALNLRSEAPSGSVVKVLPKGTVVTWYGYHKIPKQDELWLYVTDSKTTGYVNKKYLK